VAKTGKQRIYTEAMSRDYLNHVCMGAVASGSSSKEVVDKILDEIGVAVNKKKLEQRMRKLKNKEMSPRNDHRKIPDFVRQVKEAGGDAVHEVGPDGQVKYVGVVLPGAEAFMTSGASLRVSTIDGMHVKGVEGVGVILLVTTKTGDSHYLILGEGWVLTEAAPCLTPVFALWHAHHLLGRGSLMDGGTGLAAALAAAAPDVRKLPCFIHALRPLPQKLKEMVSDAVNAPTPEHYAGAMERLQKEAPEALKNLKAMIETHAPCGPGSAITGGQLTSTAAEVENASFSTHERSQGVVSILAIASLKASRQAKAQLDALAGAGLHVPAYQQRLAAQKALARQLTISPIEGSRRTATAYELSETIYLRGKPIQRKVIVRIAGELDLREPGFYGKWTCSCGGDGSEEPCCHVIRVAVERSVPLHRLIPRYCETTTLREGLAAMAQAPAVVGPFLVDTSIALPPLRAKRGAPVQKRYPSAGEPRRRRRLCRLCGGTKHWAKTCVASQDVKDAYRQKCQHERAERAQKAADSERETKQSLREERKRKRTDRLAAQQEKRKAQEQLLEEKKRAVTLEEQALFDPELAAQEFGLTLRPDPPLVVDLAPTAPRAIPARDNVAPTARLPGIAARAEPLRGSSTPTRGGSKGSAGPTRGVSKVDAAPPRGVSKGSAGPTGGVSKGSAGAKRGMSSGSAGPTARMSKGGARAKRGMSSGS
jgi:hypothetical protein